MNDLLALKGVALVATILGLAMAALWLAVTQGFTTFLTPSPETTVEQFLRALQAGRYPAARDQLDERLRRTTSVDDLRTLADLLERRRGGIRHVRDAETRRDHETRVRVVVAFGDGTATPVEFPLRQEHGLWRIASIGGLQNLVARDPVR
ncbi:MAG TPA: hypothetical protein VIN09_09945 [Chloroflexota bacterium]